MPRHHGLNKRRSRSKPPVRRQTPSHLATFPLQIWVTDISWLRGPAVGVFYYLNFVMDLFSRQIVGYEVYENESSERLAAMISRATVREGGRAPDKLHSNNGSPMKAVALLELCYRLGIVISNSRPQTSDANSHIEALFRTTKYWLRYLYGGFSDLLSERQWMRELRHLLQGPPPPSSSSSSLRPELRYPQRRAGWEPSGNTFKTRWTLLRCHVQDPSRWVKRTTRNWSPTVDTWTTTPADYDSRQRSA